MPASTRLPFGDKIAVYIGHLTGGAVDVRAVETYQRNFSNVITVHSLLQPLYQPVTSLFSHGHPSPSAPIITQGIRLDKDCQQRYTVVVDDRILIRKEVHRMNNRIEVSVTNFVSEAILCTAAVA